VALRVVGAGMGRTATLSLKGALEQLLGGRCYHMAEVFANPDHASVWDAAYRGSPPDWDEFLEDYVACVDWPAVGFWRELSEQYPDAIILLSTRDSRKWWESADATVLTAARQAKDAPPGNPFTSLVESMFGATLTLDLDNKDACVEAYERHNAHVRANAPKDRLVDWQPSDGWEPICAALNLPVPDEDFPHVNTKEDWTEKGVLAVIEEAQRQRAGS